MSVMISSKERSVRRQSITWSVEFTIQWPPQEGEPFFVGADNWFMESIKLYGGLSPTYLDPQEKPAGAIVTITPLEFRC